jgi:DNA-binding XRE family transcriptional regulator
MIYSDTEYQKALQQIADSDKYFESEGKKLSKKGYSVEEIERLLSPSMSIMEDLKNDIDWYERMKRGDLGTGDLEYLGRMLIGLRIASGLTQKELANCLEISGEEVIRNEQNEYHGIRISQAQEILDLFAVRMKIQTGVPLKREQVLNTKALLTENENVR